MTHASDIKPCSEASRSNGVPGTQSLMWFTSPRFPPTSQPGFLLDCDMQAQRGGGELQLLHMLEREVHLLPSLKIFHH